MNASGMPETFRRELLKSLIKTTRKEVDRTLANHFGLDVAIDPGSFVDRDECTFRVTITSPASGAEARVGVSLGESRKSIRASLLEAAVDVSRRALVAEWDETRRTRAGG